MTPEQYAEAPEELVLRELAQVGQVDRLSHPDHDAPRRDTRGNDSLRPGITSWVPQWVHGDDGATPDQSTRGGQHQVRGSIGHSSGSRVRVPSE